MKTFLRIYEKICGEDSQNTYNSLTLSWGNLTTYVKQMRNKNYAVLRNSYGI